MDLTDAGLREREARDLAAHVVIEAGLGREAWPIVMLALDAARAEQRETSVKIVQADEEMDGAMPDTIWNACITRDGCAEVLRAAVRVTKRNIIAAIRTQGETR